MARINQRAIEIENENLALHLMPLGVAARS